MTPHAWVFGIMAFFGLKAAGWLPFQNELQQAITYLIPFLPYIIMLWVASGLLGNVFAGVSGLVKKIYEVGAALVYGIVFTVIVVPTMLADSFLLGPIAMHAWKWQSVQVLSLVVNGLMYWLLTKTPTTVPRRIIVTSIVASVVFVFGGYFSQHVFNTHWLEFRARNGLMWPSPVASVDVKGGDTIHFVAIGYAFGNAGTAAVPAPTLFPPTGDEENLVSDSVHAWKRPLGEMQFLVTRPTGPSTEVYVEDLTSGPGDILWWSFKEIAGGYYASGKATVPPGTAPGRLGLEFLNLVPTEGYLKVTLTINPTQTRIVKAGKGFITHQKGPRFTTETKHVLYSILIALVVGGTFIGMSVNAYQSKVGVFFRIPDIGLSTAVVAVAMFGGEWFFFEGGTLKALFWILRGYVGW